MHKSVLAGAMIAGLLWAVSARSDEMELTSGARFQGTVVNRTESSVTMKTRQGSSGTEITFQNSQIKRLVIGGKVVNLGGSPPAAPVAPIPPVAKPGPTPLPAPMPGRPTVAPTAGTAGRPVRTRAEVEVLIDQAGKQQPDWWDSVKLNYPSSVDLTWARPPKGAPWDANKWLGQYMWSVINPNPGRHKQGIRLLHHVLTVNKNDPAKLAQTMKELGRTYANYLGDWARAAYWWRKGGAERDSNASIALAECYWELGCKAMAVELLSKAGSVNSGVIRLWSDMGETAKALDLAKIMARSFPHEAYFVAGDVCRSARRYPEAIEYYGKVLSAGKPEKRDEKYVTRARINRDAVKIFDSLDLRRVPDGNCVGSSMGYRGDVQVSVAVKGGKIVSVRVTQQQEDGYFYHMCNPALLRIIEERQGVAGVDAVSGATVTAEAIINATAKALAGAMK